MYFFFFKQFGLYKLYLLLLNTISSLFSVTWICIYVFFFSRQLLTFDSMWIYSSLFVYCFSFLFFFFFWHRVLGHDPYKFYCRSWIKYPGGCLTTQVVNWIHWVPFFFFFEVLDHELGKSPFVKYWARYLGHLLFCPWSQAMYLELIVV